MLDNVLHAAENVNRLERVAVRQGQTAGCRRWGDGPVLLLDLLLVPWMAFSPYNDTDG
jgi:hypothetical protein